MEKTPADSGLSWMRILGFASYQGFLYSIFYMGTNCQVTVGPFSFERAELLCVLVFLAATLAAACFARPRGFARRAQALFWALCCVPMICGVVLMEQAVQAFPSALPVAGALVGIFCAVSFLAWVKALAAPGARVAACEVFAATGIAGACCFALMALPAQAMAAVPKALPLASCAALACLAPQGRLGTAGEGCAGAFPQASGAAHLTERLDPLSPNRTALSAAQALLNARMLFGISVFGLAAGFVEVSASNPGSAATPAFSGAIAVLALLCIAVLQAIMPRNPNEREAFAGTYRIAVLVILCGFLFLPALAEFSIPGQSIILGGHLGLTAAFLAVFLAMAKMSGVAATTVAAAGFFALYAGEAAGIAFAGAFGSSALGQGGTALVMAFAGLAVLVAYLFLFTERDFSALAAVVDEPDYEQAARERIATGCGLSKREAEVLDLALRGRTNERIAQELFVAKSTADTHLRRIYAKCGVHNRQELIDLAERTREDLMRP